MASLANMVHEATQPQRLSAEDVLRYIVRDRLISTKTADPYPSDQLPDCTLLGFGSLHYLQRRLRWRDGVSVVGYYRLLPLGSNRGVLAMSGMIHSRT